MNITLPLSFNYSDGLEWKVYLEHVSAIDLHQRRYAQDPDRADIDFFRELPVNLQVIILADPACPDCAWAVPYITRLLHESGGIEVRFFVKQTNSGLMDSLMTRGKRATPKLAIIQTSSRDVRGTWGPRPAPIQRYVEESVGRIEPGVWKREVFSYYRNRGLDDLYAEIRELF